MLLAADSEEMADLPIEIDAVRIGEAATQSVPRADRKMAFLSSSATKRDLPRGYEETPSGSTVALSSRPVSWRAPILLAMKRFRCFQNDLVDFGVRDPEFGLES